MPESLLDQTVTVHRLNPVIRFYTSYIKLATYIVDMQIVKDVVIVSPCENDELIFVSDQSVVGSRTWGFSVGLIQSPK